MSPPQNCSAGDSLLLPLKIVHFGVIYIVNQPSPTRPEPFFPKDAATQAHWRRAGRYLPAHIQAPCSEVAHRQLGQPTQAPGFPVAFETAMVPSPPASTLPWTRWQQQWCRFFTRLTAPSTLFSAALLLLALGVVPDLTRDRRLSPAAQARLSPAEGPPVLAQVPGNGAGPPTSVDSVDSVGSGPSASTPTAPEPLELEGGGLQISQLFRGATLPQWSDFESALTQLGMRSRQLGNLAVEPVEPESTPVATPPQPRPAVTRGDNRRGENLERAELFDTAFDHANLFEGNFKGANLFGVTLTSANAFASGLEAANLYGTQFDEANLYESDLRNANLFKTDLRGANLYRADLSGANLFGADLTGANLFGANLTGANVKNTNLEAALLCQTLMPDGSQSNRDCP